MSSINSLFTPIKLGQLDLTNRVVMAPMTRRMSKGNIPGEDTVQYYRKRAAGGVGLIITEGTCIDHKAANAYEKIPFFYSNQALSAWRRVVEAVHAEGAKIAAQLWHVGAARDLGAGPDPDVPGYSPSGMFSPGKYTHYEMTKNDIEEVVASFARAAKNAQQLGFDAVEIHAAHGYLIDQFFWQETNLRTDEYGGSLEKRSRFAVEIVSAIRQAVGTDFAILFRWSQWKQQDYSAKLVNSEEELKKFLLPLKYAGVDILHCSTRRFWEQAFDGCALNLAALSRRISGLPTIAVGSVALDGAFLSEEQYEGKETLINTSRLEELARAIDRQEFDLVAIGRGLIANPSLVNQISLGDFESLKPYDKSMLDSLD